MTHLHSFRQKKREHLYNQELGDLWTFINTFLTMYDLSVSLPLAVRVGPNDRVMTVLIQSGISEAMTGVIRVYLQLVLEILHMNCFDNVLPMMVLFIS